MAMKKEPHNFRQGVHRHSSGKVHMRQTKNEETIREWVEKTFMIDTGQRRNLLTPKPVIREIAKKHASMQQIMATVAGERHVDRETWKAVQSMLDCVSIADIDTEATYILLIY